MKRIVAIAVLLIAGCGNDGIDREIGATCVTDRDCVDRCYNGPEFPGGFCSLQCQSDLDCPIDTLCMSTNGGTCMFECPQFDCGRLGPGWRCRLRSHAAGGDANVCSG